MRLELSIEARPFACGEALPAAVKLVNDGAAEEKVDIGEEAPIVYEFQERGGQRMRSVSRAARFARKLAGSPHGPGEIDEAGLTPGGSVETGDDLCALGQGRIDPGDYDVTAIWGAETAAPRSNAVKVLIVPLEASRWLGVYSPYQSGFSFLSHHQDALMERNTEGFFVAEGVFRRREKRLPADGLPQFALSVDLAPKLSGNVRAWLEGDGLAFSSGAAVETGLQNAVLLHPGFQTGEERAIFAAIGGMGGRQALRLFRVNGKQGAAVGEPIDCGDKRIARACIANPADEDDALVVVWAETAKKHTCIRAQRMGLDGVARGGAVMLLERNSPLLSMSMDAVMIDEPGFVHALWGPYRESPEQQKVEYTLTTLKGARDMRQREIPVPDDVTVSEWAVGGGLESHLIVAAAASSGNILWADVQKFEDWNEMGGEQKGAHSLTLMKAPQYQYWAAAWLDPKSGLQYGIDPAYH